MAKVNYIKKQYHTTFRRLPNGAVFFIGSTGPQIRNGSRSTVSTVGPPTNSIGTAVADVSVDVVNVRRVILKSQGSIV